MESKKINQLATELTPALSDLTIIGDPSTGISKKITLSQMASLFTGTVEEYANLAAFPLVGVADTIYIALDTNVLYRWNTGTNAYVELSPNIINSLVFNDANGFDGTISLVGSVATLTITTALTTGSVGFIGASGALLQDNANFFWDDTNNRLGLGTNAPTTALDAFGSGIIGRLNGTSTNNAFLGFASAGSNKWSIGNVQSDHRFRIYNEATTSELISVLSTGEFGIGIANPTTKFHIDGGASALIANLDANVSVAKSLSFRSDNSNRINIEVSGTESGSNAGADFFLRTYTDLGALIETPFSIVRSTGVTTIKSLTLTNALSVANGGTGSTTQNFVDLTTTQSIGGLKTFTGALSGTSATFSGNMAIGGTTITDANMLNVIGNQSSVNIGVVLNNTNSTHARIYALQNVNGNFNIRDYTAGVDRLTIASTGNVGIGVTPFVNTIGKSLDLVNGAGIFAASNNFYVVGNAYFDSAWKYKATSGAAFININSGGGGNIGFVTAPSGTAGNTISFVERFAIGNVNARNAEIDTKGNVIQSFVGSGGTVGAGSSWSMTLNQVQFEFQTSYMVDVVGFYAPGGVNIAGYATGIIHFTADGGTSSAQYSNITSNGFVVSVSATTAGVFTVSFTNVSGSSMSNNNARIIKLNRMN